ncbi:MAG: WD40 repeat domain-containing serine/threonine-protein kinase [Cyanobacteria bacterium P01_B01_bin.77]
MKPNIGERYNIVKRLGKGQNGQTSLAYVLTPSSAPISVVIKQIYRPSEPLDDLTKRLKAVGQHPQLPALLNSWQSSDGQFLVFEHIAAPSIQTHTPPWPATQLETELLSLLPVLEHLHSFRLVHGDIRPANIRQASPTQTPILVDLRITQRLNKHTPTLATTVGDAAYAAPEQTLGQLVYASDLYSLGLVAIHLLTGLAPFDLYSVADSRWIWPDFLTDPLPKNLSQVLPKLLERSLERRYSSAAQVLVDLKKSPAVSLLDKARSLLPNQDFLPSLQVPTRLLSPADTAKTSAFQAAGQSTAPISWHRFYQLTPGITTALALQGKVLALGTHTGSVLICDLTAGAEMFTLEGRHHRDRITALVIHPQGHTLYSSSSDGTVKLWDLSRGNLLHTLTQPGWLPTDLAMAPPYLIVGDGGGHITLWDLEQLTSSHSFNQHQDWVSAIAASNNRLASISRDRTLRLWSIPDKKLIDTLPIRPSQALALHPSGNYGVVGNNQGQVDVWTVGLSAKPNRLCQLEDSITSLALSPDARLLAVGSEGNTLRVYQGTSGECVSELVQGWGGVAIAFDGHTLVSSSQDETVTVWRRIPPRLARD